MTIAELKMVGSVFGEELFTLIKAGIGKVLVARSIISTVNDRKSRVRFK